MERYEYEDGGRNSGAFVAGFAWVAMVVLAIVHALHYGTAMPALDDLHMVDVVGTNAIFSWDQLWAQHNEHRLPLPKLLYILLVGGARDFRAGTWFDVALLAALALASIRAAGRLRGGVRATDAVFPCLLLNWGHAENLLNSFQICFVLPVALLGTLLIAVTWSDELLSPRRAAVIALSTVLLPACGTVGLVAAPFFAAWSCYAAARAWRSHEHGRRVAARIALAGVVLVLAFSAAYLARFHLASGFVRPTLRQSAVTTLQFVAQSFGWKAYDFWPWSGLVVVLLAAVSMALLVAILLRRPAERQRAAGVLACFAASGAIAASVGFGRAIDGDMAGLSGRYGLLSSLIWLCIAFAWTLYGVGGRGLAAAGGIVRGALAILAALIALSNLSGGARYGWSRFFAARQLGWDVEAGMKLRTIAARNWGRLFYGERVFFEALRRMQQADMGPFWRSAEEIAAHPRPVETYPMMKTVPTSAVSADAMLARRVDDELVLIVHAEGEIAFSASTEARAIRGRYGVYPPATKRAGTDGMSFQVEWLGDDGTRTLLAQWRLDPLRAAADRGIHDFEIALPGGTLGEVKLRVTDEPGRIDAMDWGFWTDVEMLSGPP